jgi:hypothetical protein
MATFLYICEVNNEEFEEVHSVHTKLTECPICKANGSTQHEPKRLIASANPGKVELTGNEYNAKIKEDAANMSRDIHSSEKLYSNVLGETKYQQMQQQLDKGKRERHR